MSDVNTLLSEGIAAAKAGKKREAAPLLAQVVQQDKRNTEAWFWLAASTDDLNESAACLRRVLKIDPNHNLAQRALAIVEQQLGVTTTPVDDQPAPTTRIAPAPILPVPQVTNDPIAVQVDTLMRTIMTLTDRTVIRAKLNEVLVLNPNYQAAIEWIKRLDATEPNGKNTKPIVNLPAKSPATTQPDASTKGVAIPRVKKTWISKLKARIPVVSFSARRHGPAILLLILLIGVAAIMAIFLLTRGNRVDNVAYVTATPVVEKTVADATEEVAEATPTVVPTTQALPTATVIPTAIPTATNTPKPLPTATFQPRTIAPLATTTTAPTATAVSTKAAIAEGKVEVSLKGAKYTFKTIPVLEVTEIFSDDSVDGPKVGTLQRYTLINMIGNYQSRFREFPELKKTFVVDNITVSCTSSRDDVYICLIQNSGGDFVLPKSDGLEVLRSLIGEKNNVSPRMVFFLSPLLISSLK